MKDINWNEVRDFYESGRTWRDIEERFGIGNSAIQKAFKEGLLVKRSREETFRLRSLKPAWRHTQESKNKLSLKRKQFLKDNPEKHHWRSQGKFNSKPCNNVKDFLKSSGISFVEEFDPQIEGRFFSIDIAIPDKMIAIEINGRHHYESNGSLKPYYQERHNLLESAGWKVFEIFYTACFKFEAWVDFVNYLKGSEVVKDFDYFNYVPKKEVIKIKMEKNKNPSKKSYKRASRKIVKCPNCENLKHQHAKLCESCYRMEQRKVTWPTKEELEDILTKLPMTKIGAKYNVSDNSIRKWCKYYGIETKGRKWSARK